MSMLATDYAKAHMIEQIMRCGGVRAWRARQFRTYLERSPLCRLRQITEKIYGYY